MPKVLVALVLFPVGLLILTGCSKNEAVSTPAEKAAFKPAKPTPEQVKAAMDRMQKSKSGVVMGAPQSAQPPK